MLLRDLRLKLWIGRLRKKKKILYFPRPVSLQHQLTGVKKVCICMPAEHEPFYDARACLLDVDRKYLDITLVLDKAHELLAEHSGRIVTYPRELKKPFPVHEEQLKDIPKDYDIAIDLSPRPAALTAYITGTRGKKMTIGTKSRDFDPFYTVLIKPSEDYRHSVMTMLSVAGLLTP